MITRSDRTNLTAALVEFERGMRALTIATGKAAAHAARNDVNSLKQSAIDNHEACLEAEMACVEICRTLRYALAA